MPETKYPWLNHKVLYTVMVVLLVVLVAGATAWYRQQKQIAQDLNQSAPNTSSQSQDATANWKTYTNTQYGFEFKYPKSSVDPMTLQSAELLKYATAYESNGYTVIQVLSNSVDQLIISPKKLSGAIDYSKQVEGTDYSVQDIVLGGSKAKQYENLNSQLLSYPKVIRFDPLPNNWEAGSEIRYLALDKDPKVLALFDQILSTFKFTK